MDFISAAIMLLLIMDPVGNLPVFAAILKQVPERARVRLLLRELLIAYIVLCAFLFMGHRFLSLIGVKQSTLGIAGGIILFLIALRMVFPQHGLHIEEDVTDPFIVPLAVPLIAGPSAMTMLLLIVSRHPDKLLVWLGALTLAWAVTAAIILMSGFFIRLLGDRVLRATTKLMGMLLIMIAMQMLLDGVRIYLHLNR